MTPRSDVNIRNLTGDWTIDKARTDNLDAALKLQGIGWLRRKAVTSGTITLNITQTTDSNSPVTNLMMQQGLRGIFPGVEQTRALNWTDHEQVDSVSGAGIVVRSRFVRGVKDGDAKVKPVFEVETDSPKNKSDVESFLGTPVSVRDLGEKDGEGEESLEKAFVQDSITCADSGWTAEQIWAVEKDGDEIFLTCKAVAVKGSSTENASLVYKLEEQ
ncbi:hypothetical protein BDW59DRAFT_160230 [Aspergillus cavernicola]|uniref:Uncharacterized protein n=1 Tax=Aspergillus cavernicola TaxID=176166 RepID=A0ABR4III7_9EURO